MRPRIHSISAAHKALGSAEAYGDGALSKLMGQDLCGRHRVAHPQSDSLPMPERPPGTHPTVSGLGTTFPANTIASIDVCPVFSFSLIRRCTDGSVAPAIPGLHRDGRSGTRRDGRFLLIWALRAHRCLDSKS